MYSKEEAKQLKQDFWEGFSRYTNFYSIQIGVPIKWMLYKTGIKGLEFKFYIEKKLVQVIIEVNLKNENKRFDIYLELNKYRKILEESMEYELSWVDDCKVDDHKIVSRIIIEEDQYNFHKRDDWPEIYKFMAKNMYGLQSNFEEVHDIFKEKFGSL